MIGFIGQSLQLQEIITDHNQWLSNTRSIPDWSTSFFSFDRPDSVQIYESVTSSASVVCWLTLHSWILNSLTDTEWLNSLELNWTLLCQSQTQNYFTTGSLPPIGFVLAPSPLRLRPEFISPLNTCGHSPYITSSLTRGWVYHLQLLLALASSSSTHSRKYKLKILGNFNK
jgi:hypothetical protein